MTRFAKFTLLCFSFFTLSTGVAFSQLTGGGLYEEGCFDPEQVCPSCMCLMIYDPVCGCDDRTYSNSCFAYNSGITSWKEGACDSYASDEDGTEKQLRFYSPVEQEVVIRVYDQLGREVATPFSGWVEAGKEYLVPSPHLPSGNYLCLLSNGTEVLMEPFAVR